MPDQNDPLDSHRTEELMEVIHERVDVVSRLWLVRPPVTATGQAQDVEMVCKLRGQIIENMGRVSEPRQKDQRFALASPVQKFQRYSIYFDELFRVRRFINPGVVRRLRDQGQ